MIQFEEDNGLDLHDRLFENMTIGSSVPTTLTTPIAHEDTICEMNTPKNMIRAQLRENIVVAVASRSHQHTT